MVTSNKFATLELCSMKKSRRQQFLRWAVYTRNFADGLFFWCVWQYKKQYNAKTRAMMAKFMYTTFVEPNLVRRSTTNDNVELVCVNVDRTSCWTLQHRIQNLKTPQKMYANAFTSSRRRSPEFPIDLFDAMVDKVGPTIDEQMKDAKTPLLASKMKSFKAYSKGDRTIEINRLYDTLDLLQRAGFDTSEIINAFK